MTTPYDIPLDLSILSGMERIAQGITHEDYVSGDTGFYDTDGTLNPDPTANLQAPYIWVRLASNRSAVPVWNMRVADNYAGLAVITAVSRSHGRREIIGIDNERALAMFTPEQIRSASTPNKLPDDISVSSDSLYPGRVEPYDGLTVYVRTFIYDSTNYPNLTLDLTSVEAALSVGEKVMVVVGFDTSALALTYVAGTERSLAYPLDSSNAVNEAAGIVTSDSIIRLGGVVVQEAQTDITWTDITDLREWLASAPVNFDAIMTDFLGAIMVDFEGNVMVAS